MISNTKKILISILILSCSAIIHSSESGPTVVSKKPEPPHDAVLKHFAESKSSAVYQQAQMAKWQQEITKAQEAKPADSAK